jgi:hypothetical protein
MLMLNDATATEDKAKEKPKQKIQPPQTFDEFLKAEGLVCKEI